MQIFQVFHHLPNGRGYYAIDENNNGQPDVLENPWLQDLEDSPAVETDT